LGALPSLEKCGAKTEMTSFSPRPTKPNTATIARPRHTLLLNADPLVILRMRGTLMRMLVRLDRTIPFTPVAADIS